MFFFVFNSCLVLQRLHFLFTLFGTLYSICFGNSLAQVLLNNKVDLHRVYPFDFVAFREFIIQCKYILSFIQKLL